MHFDLNELLFLPKAANVPPLPMLCSLAYTGAPGERLVALARASGRRVFPFAEAAVCDPLLGFVSATAGERVRVGVLYVSLLPKLYRMTADVVATARAAGAERLHPEAAFALAVRYPQPELLALVNDLRPVGSPLVDRAIVWHTALTDPAGYNTFLGLDSSGIAPPAAGSVYAYRQVQQYGYKDEDERLLVADESAPENTRRDAIERVRRRWGEWPERGRKEAVREMAFLVALPSAAT